MRQSKKQLTKPRYKPRRPYLLTTRRAAPARESPVRCCWIMSSSAGVLTSAEVPPAAAATATLSN